MTTIASSGSPRPMASWRFWLPLAAQAALILAIPAQVVYTHVVGETVILQTGPVDPYNVFRGYYVILSYDISQPNQLQHLPGWADIPNETANSNQPSFFSSGNEFYVILEAPERASQDVQQPPAAWEPVRVSRDRPSTLPSNQIALKGNFRRSRVSYGLETYYIPEEQRYEINENISQANQTQGTVPPFVVEIKVTRQGQATPVSLWIRDRNYRF